MIIFIVLSSCNDTEPDLSLTVDDIIRIDIHKEIQINELDLGEIIGVVMDESRVYLLSKDPHIIVVLNMDGEIINSYNARGGGPGELQNPIRLSKFNDRIYVLDSSKYVVEVFDENLKYQTTIILEDRPWAFSTNNNSILISSLNIKKADVNIYQEDSMKKVSIAAIDTHPLDIVGLPIQLSDNHFLFVRNYRNEFYIKDHNGKTIKNFKNPYLADKSPLREEQGIALPAYELVKNVYTMESYFLTLTGYLRSFGQTIFKFSEEGEVQAVYSIPTFLSVSSNYNNTIIGFNADTRIIYFYKIPTA
jgi:hypothetical protein